MKIQKTDIFGKIQIGICHQYFQGFFLKFLTVLYTALSQGQSHQRNENLISKSMLAFTKTSKMNSHSGTQNFEFLPPYDSAMLNTIVINIFSHFSVIINFNNAIKQ